MSNIIFDWTGVIKDAVHDHLKIVNIMFEDFGLPPLSLEEMKETWKQPYMDFYQMYVPDLTMERQKEAYFKAYEQVEGSKAYPGMPSLVKKLHSKGKKIVVLSSDSPKSILGEIEDFGLEGVFDDMDLEVHDKVEHIADLMKKNNMKVEETIIVGDTNNEIEAARSVGIKVVSVTWGLCSQENLKQYNPDFLVNTVGDLEKILV
jgi:phosphoglycolate phosphatase